MRLVVQGWRRLSGFIAPPGFLMSPQHFMTAAPSKRRPSRSPRELTLLLLFLSSRPGTPVALWVLRASLLDFICAFCPCTLPAAAAVEMVLKSVRCSGDTRFSGSMRPWNRGERLAFFRALMAIPLGSAVSTVILLPSRIVSSIKFATPGLVD